MDHRPGIDRTSMEPEITLSGCNIVVNGQSFARVPSSNDF